MDRILKNAEILSEMPVAYRSRDIAALSLAYQADRPTIVA
jgi:hypothetical protein